jgi:hypothetical protein
MRLVLEVGTVESIFILIFPPKTLLVILVEVSVYCSNKIMRAHTVGESIVSPRIWILFSMDRHVEELKLKQRWEDYMKQQCRLYSHNNPLSV